MSRRVREGLGDGEVGGGLDVLGQPPLKVAPAHASRATVAIRDASDQLEIRIEDDGVGGADPARGSGLRGLEDRLAAVDGHLVVESPAGCDTVIRAGIPLP